MASASSTTASDFNFQLNVSMGPVYEDGGRDIIIRGLRVQIPEVGPHTPTCAIPRAIPEVGPYTPPRAIPRAIPIPTAPLKTVKPIKQEQKEQEQKEEVYEYSEAPLKYTWADQPSQKSDDLTWQHLMWNATLKKYNMEYITQHYQGTFQTFCKSPFYQHKDKYAYRHIGDLMGLYVELVLYRIHLYNKNLQTGNHTTSKEYDDLSRREMLINRFFIPNKIVWNSSYFDAYMEWSGSEANKRLNRYQRMASFLQSFFNIIV